MSGAPATREEWAAWRAYSPGWGATVQLGPGQERIRRELLASIRHRSHTWHTAPRLRDFGRSSSTAHRALHRLAALGVIALQATLPQHGPRNSQGRLGRLRFTFGVRYWRRSPLRRGQLARWLGRRPQISLGQLALELVPPVAYPLTTPPDHAAGGLGSLPSLAGGSSTGQLTLELPRSFDEQMARFGSGRSVLGW